MRTTLFVILLLCSSYSWSQKGWDRVDKRAYEEADFAFYQGEFRFALEVFEGLHSRHKDYPPLDLRYGTCLLNLSQRSDTASMLIKGAMTAGEPEALYQYARSLHREYQFEKAIEYFTLYLQEDKRDIDNIEVDRYIQMCRRAKRMIAQPVDIRIKNLGPEINSENKEYVPIVSGDGENLYFTSRRPGSTAQLKDPNGEFFEDIYHSQKSGSEWGEAKNLGLPINSETHDATVAISADGSAMIIYRTNQNLTGGDLWMSQNKNGFWSKPKKLSKEINSEYQEASACLSADGEMLIFSSNRPGGYGGKDLYRVVKLPNGEWSQAKNLGASINSSFDEDAPFLDIDSKTLYFASNGHETMGGYDIFITSLIDKEVWSAPENLGYPLNTVEDDIYLVVNPGGRSGYYSSEKERGFGQLDIYEVDFVYRQNHIMVIKGEVMDFNGNPIQAKITLLDDTEKEIQGVYNVNANTGRFIMILNPLTVYKVFIEAEGYRTQQDELFFVFPNEGELDFQIAPYILTK